MAPKILIPSSVNTKKLSKQIMSASKEVALTEKTISQTVEKEQSRLFNFIRKRVKSTVDAEDILQDVFYQFVRVSEEVNAIEKPAHGCSR